MVELYISHEFQPAQKKMFKFNPEWLKTITVSNHSLKIIIINLNYPCIMNFLNIGLKKSIIYFMKKKTKCVQIC